MNSTNTKMADGGWRIDWGRVAYWVVKFLSLAAMLAAVAGLVYLGYLVGRATFDVAAATARWAWDFNWKRGFYSLCIMAIFFYAARATRGLALWLEAKANHEREEI